MTDRINATHSALMTLADEELRGWWIDVLSQLTNAENLHGMVAGRCCRLLLDEHVLTVVEMGVRLSRNLSRGNAPASAAAWLEGFLGGSGLVLLHQRELWALIDGWVAELSADHFTEVLPLLRRTFSAFAPAERRQMGELARGGNGSTRVVAPTVGDVDETRALRVLPTLALLLGVQAPESLTP
jgi:hypothetical protein